MPRKAKAGVLEKMIEKEVQRSVKSTIKKLGLATSDDIKSLVSELKAIRKQLALRKKPKSLKGRVGRKRKYEKCTVRGCNKPHYAKGLCASHYQKQRRDAKIGKTRKRKKTTKKRAARKK